MARKKRKKSRRRNKKSNTSLAKRQRAIIKILENKEASQPRKLTFLEKIWSYRKWAPIPVLVAFVVSYWSYYPKPLEVTDRIVGVTEPFSNFILIKNTNRYKARDVTVFVYIKADFVTSKNNRFKDVVSDDWGRFLAIKPFKSKHLYPKFVELINPGDKVVKIEKASVLVVTSYKTPFLYPDIENDTTRFVGMLNSNGEVLYLER